MVLFDHLSGGGFVGGDVPGKADSLVNKPRDHHAAEVKGPSLAKIVVSQSFEAIRLLVKI